MALSSTHSKTMKNKGKMLFQKKMGKFNRSTLQKMLKFLRQKEQDIKQYSGSQQRNDSRQPLKHT